MLIYYMTILKKYLNINLDYKIITNLKLFKKEINKYKNENKIENISTKDLKKIINIKTICSKINTYINYYFNRNKSLHEHLLNIKYKDQYITTNEVVIFKRKNKTYKKFIFFYY